MGRQEEPSEKEKILRQIDLAITIAERVKKEMDTLKKELVEIYKEVQNTAYEIKALD